MSISLKPVKMQETFHNYMTVMYNIILEHLQRDKLKSAIYLSNEVCETVKKKIIFGIKDATF